MIHTQSIPFTLIPKAMFLVVVRFHGFPESLSGSFLVRHSLTGQEDFYLSFRLLLKLATGSNSSLVF